MSYSSTSYSSTSSSPSPSRSPSEGCTTTDLSNEPTDSDESSHLTQQNRVAIEDLVPPSGLPIELIDRILDLCDYSTFLSLAQVNRFFNFYATEVLLTRELSSWHYRSIRVTSSPYKAQILSALNIRQFDMHALSYLYYSFDPKENLYHSIVSLTRFLRNHVVSIDELSLRFYSYSVWTVNEVLVCGSKLIALLEAALEKGCRRFELSGTLPRCLNYPPQRVHAPRMLTTSYQPRRPYFASWFHSYDLQQTPPPVTPPPGPPFCSFPKPVIPAPSPAWQSRLSFITDSPSLTELVMDSSLMWSPSLLSHTLNLLRNQSPVLRKLKIYQGGTAYEDYYHDATVSRCEEFFSTISLPVLESFTYMTKFKSSRRFELLFSFLTRHPNIHAVRFPLIPMFSEAEYPAFDTKTFLPNLKTLYAHGKTISWLLQDPNAFLNLERVSVEAKNDHPIRSYDDVDAALVILGSRMGVCFNSLTHLKLEFSADEDFCLWLLSHITNRRSSPIQHLKGLETLTISMKDVYAKLKVHHLDNLITWAGLFPSLTSLILDGYFDDFLFEVIKTERFTNTLEDKCPLLKECSINWWKWEKTTRRSAVDRGRHSRGDE